ncbi:MAG: helix-turn-helix domain-containing protein [Clostridia bacterium]|nr:helix-turn-helix domain-containing protein [Clostridia bacterium]
MRIFQLKNYVEKGIISAEIHHVGIKRITFDHSHDCFEIDYFFRGTGVYCINGREHRFEPGMLFFNSPADIHNQVAETPTKFVTVMFPCAVFEPELLYLLFSPDTVSSLEIPEKDRPLIESLLLEIHELAEVEPANAVHYLRCVLLKFFRLAQKGRELPHSHVQAAIIYILEHFRSGITLQEAAAHVGLAPAYLSTLFRKETGETFKNYVDNLRFYYASHLLRSTDLPVTEVCSFAGFRDYANFSRRFHEKYGYSPGKNRK